MKSILVGVDGSAAARDALNWSADLARRARLEIVAARVFSPSQAELAPDFDRELHVRQLVELDEWCGDIKGDVSATAVVLDGDAPGALLDAAESHEAGLVVVGGRDGRKRVHLDPSSVADRLAHETTLPLAVVPGGTAPLTHVVVGVDGSAGSLAAVDFVTELADRVGVGVTAVLAFEPFLEFVPETDPHSWRHEAERAVRRWVRPMERAGVPVDVDVDRDVRPVAAIVRALDAHPGAVACVGARRLSEITGLRLGSISLQLLDRKRSAVVMVPATAEG